VSNVGGADGEDGVTGFPGVSRTLERHAGAEKGLMQAVHNKDERNKREIPRFARNNKNMVALFPQPV
jgi:hypothetical protein